MDLKKKVKFLGFDTDLGRSIVRQASKIFITEQVHNYHELLLGNIPTVPVRCAQEVTQLDRYSAQYFEMFQQLVTRRGMLFNSLPALRNEFVLGIRYAKFLLSGSVDVIVFSNIPHEGFDFLLYVMAKEKGVKTLVLHQSIFLGRFFIIKDIEDFGRFDTSLGVSDVSVSVLGYRGQGQTYMRGVRGFSSFSEVLHVRCARLVGRAAGFTGRWSRVVVRHRFLKSIELIDDITFRLMSRARYRSMSVAEISSCQNGYVYFPLHLQPELTTSSLGGRYDDQIFAIERLSAWLPDGMLLFVKENPKQRSRYRDKSFYRRLEALENIILLDKSVSSSNLIRNSSAVATITGTAGWEALTEGKPAIYFGRPWYAGAPGAVEADKVLTEPYEEWQRNYHGPSIAQLDDYLSILSPKLGVGIVDQFYKQSAQEFCDATNSQNVVASIEANL